MSNKKMDIVLAQLSVCEQNNTFSKTYFTFYIFCKRTHTQKKLYVIKQDHDIVQCFKF